MAAAAPPMAAPAEAFPTGDDDEDETLEEQADTAIWRAAQEAENLLAAKAEAEAIQRQKEEGASANTSAAHTPHGTSV